MINKNIRWLFLGAVLFNSSCNTTPDITDPEDLVINEILPERFKVDVPSAISAETSLSGDNGIEITGDDIYKNLRAFIYVGTSSTDVLEQLFDAIFTAEVDSAAFFSIISAEDERQKNFELRQRVTLEGKSYRFDLEVTDEDGSQAAQLYWNSNPLELVALIKPFDLNRNRGEGTEDLFYRIEYIENDDDYDAAMTVSITNSPESDGLDNLQMFVGQNGEVIEVRGNSNHPNITLVDPSFTGGRNYAFVARANSDLNVGVVSISLPPSAVDNNDNLFEEFSILGVFESELVALGIEDQEVIDGVLTNTNAPGFNNEEGFVSSGSNVPDNPVFSTSFLDLSALSPFVPRDIRDLDLSFTDN